MARPKEHIKVQKEVKEVEGYQCANCGAVTEKGSGGAAGHHLIQYSEGGAADLHNMITLCNDCHKKWHNRTLKIDIRRF